MLFETSQPINWNSVSSINEQSLKSIGKDVPSDFGTSERDLKNGQIDIIAGRSEIRDTLAKILKLFKDFSKS